LLSQPLLDRDREPLGIVDLITLVDEAIDVISFR
jgi:hypothetical protein